MNVAMSLLTLSTVQTTTVAALQEAYETGSGLERETRPHTDNQESGASRPQDLQLQPRVRQERISGQSPEDEGGNFVGWTLQSQTQR